MSTIKVNKIENTNTTAGGVAIDSSGHVQVDGLQMPSAGALSNRNKIINGDMRIAQRSTSVTNVSGGGFKSLDRWQLFDNSGSVNLEQSTDVPAGQGFTNSFKNTVNTTGTLASLSIYSIVQTIEGYNTADLMLGTSSAKTFTVSFWCKTSVAGTYSLFIRNGAADKYYTTEFSGTNDWSKISLTIPGDTSGTWLTDNGIGLTLGITLRAGTTRIATATETWVNTGGAGDGYATSNQTDWHGTSGATFYITGVQLEVGEKATPFEHRSYGDELARCQRYYQVMSGNVGNQIFCNMSAWSSSSMYGILYYQKPMRASPTGSHSGTFEIYSGGTTAAVTDVDFERISIECCRIYASTSGMTTGRGGWMEAGAASDATIELTAEL